MWAYQNNVAICPGGRKKNIYIYMLEVKIFYMTVEELIIKQCFAFIEPSQKSQSGSESR